MAFPTDITIVIVTRNDLNNLRQTVRHLIEQSISPYQITVVDTVSDTHQETKGFCQHNQIECVSFDWNGLYPKKRQWCLDNLVFKTNWVLFLDADEDLTQKLIEHLSQMSSRAAFNDSAISGYMINSQPVWRGKKLRFGRWHKKLVLFNHKAIYYPEIDDRDIVEMGEIEGHYQPLVRFGSIGFINKSCGSLTHRITNETPESRRRWRQKHVAYATWQAHAEKRGLLTLSDRNEVSFKRLLLKKVFRSSLFRPLRPWSIFCDSFFIQLGFFDGIKGFDYALHRAWYYHKVNRAYCLIGE